MRILVVILHSALSCRIKLINDQGYVICESIVLREKVKKKSVGTHAHGKRNDLTRQTAPIKCIH